MRKTVQKKVNPCLTANSTVPLMEMRDITKIFPGVVALSHVDMEIQQGEIHLLLGENGAGKSTMIKTMLGINQPEGGEMFWLGEKFKPQSVQEAYDKGIAVIYQELSNVPCLSVMENMYLGHEYKKGIFVDWKTQRKKAREALDRVGLENIDLDINMEELGMGQRQLVEVARAVDRQARLIIMDEPTSSLSRNEIDHLLTLMESLNEDGLSILFITHKLDEAIRVGHRATVLKDGENSGYIEDISKVTEDDIIRMMVGRDLDEEYPSRDVTIGTEVFRCENLCSDKFEGITFDVKAGEVLGVFGLVGAGRTETVRGIFGVDQLAAGEIYMNEKKVNIKNPRDAIREGIVLITENRKEEGLILIHDVVENVTSVRLDKFKNKFGFIDNKKRIEAVQQYGKELHLRPLLPHQNTMNFSGGNQQKVVIMKWLTTDAEVFIFDEPTKGVDVGAKVEIYNIMNELLAEGAAIIMVSSEMKEIIGMSDRILTMHEGHQTGIVPNDETVTEEQILTLATGGKIK